MEDLTNKLQYWENKFKKTLMVSQLKEKIKLAQHQINVILTEETAKRIKFAKHFFF